jgi:hypothetical protein
MTCLFSGAPVAQLDRASGFEPEGREFESLRARQEINKLWLYPNRTSINGDQTVTKLTAYCAVNRIFAAAICLGAEACPHLATAEDFRAQLPPRPTSAVRTTSSFSIYRTDVRTGARAAWSYQAPQPSYAHVDHWIGFWKDVDVRA